MTTDFACGVRVDAGDPSPNLAATDATTADAAAAAGDIYCWALFDVEPFRIHRTSLGFSSWDTNTMSKDSKAYPLAPFLATVNLPGNGPCKFDVFFWYGRVNRVSVQDTVDHLLTFNFHTHL
jgi:hypothetical protein